MRKYQQLLLLVLSCISIIVLFIYKSENNRLKYVLQVVNFFGRKDAAFMGQFENITNDNLDFSHRLPIWQALDSSFHAYAAYWLQETANSGEALAEVVGKSKENVLFRCSIKYADGSMQEGKFRFQPWPQIADNSEFEVYSFYCGLSAMRANAQAESVLFTTKSINTYAATLRLRKMDMKNAASVSEMATICLDLTQNLLPQHYFYRNNKNMLQFFLHHKALGVNHFLVYNSDVLSTHLMRVLKQALIQIHAIPFNFPFASGTAASADQIRQIVKVNCMRRSAPNANYTMLLTANEFLYAKARLDSKSSFIEAKRNQRVSRVNVCLDAQKTLLIDNMAYDASQAVTLETLIYSLHGLNLKDTTALLSSPQATTQVPRDSAYLHHYVECVNIGANGLDNWRNELKEDFLSYLKAERSEMTMFIK